MPIGGDHQGIVAGEKKRKELEMTNPRDGAYRREGIGPPQLPYSTVTLFAKFRGRSTSVPFCTAM